MKIDPLRLLVYGLAGAICTAIIIHVARGIRLANAEAQRDAKQAAELTVLLYHTSPEAKAARLKVIALQMEAERLEFENDLRRFGARAAEEMARQRQMAKDLQAIRRELEHRR